MLLKTGKEQRYVLQTSFSVDSTTPSTSGNAVSVSRGEVMWPTRWNFLHTMRLLQMALLIFKQHFGGMKSGNACVLVLEAILMKSLPYISSKNDIWPTFSFLPFGCYQYGNRNCNLIILLLIMLTRKLYPHLQASATWTHTFARSPCL